MKRLRLTKFLLSVILLLALASAAVYYINQTFIPIKLKNIILKKVEEFTQRDVAIEKLSFSLTKGFVLTGVKIYDGPRQEGKFLFRAKTVTFGVVFIPTFKKYFFIIPRIGLNEPYLNIERNDAGSWNLSFLFSLSKKDSKAARTQAMIKSLSFDSGVISFSDSYNKRAFKKIIMDLKGNAGMFFKDSINISCAGKLDNSVFKTVARYRIGKKEVSIQLETKNILLADYINSYLGSDNIKIDSGICEASLNINIADFKEVGLEGNVSVRGFKGDLYKMGIEGDYQIAGDIKFNARDFSNLKYKLALDLKDANLSTNIKQVSRLQKINCSLDLTEKQWTTRNASLYIYNSPFVLSAVIDSPHQDFVADVEFSSTLSLVQIYGAPETGIENGTAKIKATVKYKKDATYALRGESAIDNLILHQKGISIKGDFFISGESSGKFGDWEAAIYKGTVNFKNTKIEETGLLPIISDARGEADFSTKNISIKKMTGFCADTNIILSGNINYEEEPPDISIKLKADNLSLPKLLASLPPEISSKLKDISVAGDCSLDLAFRGKPGMPETLDYEGNISTKTASLNVPHWPYKISNINGSVLFKKQNITWDGLSFFIKDTTYNSTGKFSNFKTPSSSFSLVSKDINVSAEIKVEDNTINIVGFDGKCRNSIFALSGKVYDIKSLNSDIKGSVDLELSDTPFILTKYSDILKKINPQGVTKFNFNINGPLTSLPDCNLSLEAASEKIHIWGLQLDNLSLDCRMKDRFLEIPILSAQSYGGLININSRTNLKAQEQPYIINIDIKDVDLNKLIQDMDFKNKKVSGTFALQAVLNGYLNDKGSLKGSGWLQVSDGYLWEFPIMRGMLEVIFMAPAQYITITDVFGNFSIHNNRIYTEDFKMLSKTVSLLWVGSLGLDATLDFGITGRFAGEITKNVSSPGKIASAILHEAGQLIMEIKLTGSLTNPQYQIVPFPIDKILKEKVLYRVRDIFGSVL